MAWNGGARGSGNYANGGNYAHGGGWNHGGAWQGGAGNYGRGGQGGWNRGNGYAGGGWNRGGGPGQYNGHWDRGWRNDGRYNWEGWRDEHPGWFQLGVYDNPFGWGYGYTPFDVGWTIDPAFYGEDYWIGDPGYYRLPPPEGDTRWIRYYNDALLVDVNSGYVVDVIHNFFD
ncbi:MAG: RcnB family protein [Alphaproteobacteria bacterium]|nr:RcnB family protein [Alphaproteobacteria bacterium]